MIKKLLAVIALAAMSFVMMPIDDADARRGGGGGGIRGGGARVAPAFRAGPRVVVRPVYRRHVVRRYYAAPVFIAGGSCAWLRQRAVVTGSPYWWRRYNACRYGY